MNLDYGRKRALDVLRAKKLARELTARERWPREQLERWQQDRLDRLVKHAVAHSPFWRERLGSIKGDVRLADLPTLDKQTMMDNYDTLVTDPRLRRDDLLAHLDGLDHDALYLGQYRAMMTSGSSGLKGLFVYGRSGWVGLLAQFFRYNDWLAMTPRLPRRRIAPIGGAGPTHMTRRCAESVDIGMHRLLPLPVTMPIAEMVAALNDFRPDFINVYPSIAALLAAEQEAGRLRICLSAMSTGGELRTPELAARLERSFGVKPADFYAMTEGLWGCECEARSGVHLFEDMTIVENVGSDGQPVPKGEPGGRLLVTNLYNNVQPLIRFEVSDVLTLDTEPCGCGRTLAKVRAIEGRRDDLLELDGVLILPMQFSVVSADPAVREFQVVQSHGGVRIRVVLQNGADPESVAARLRARVEERLRTAGVSEPCVAIDHCQALKRGPGGKLQLVVAERPCRALASPARAPRRPCARRRVCT